MKIIVLRPESLGVVTGCTFLITMFVFIPVPFGNNLLEKGTFPQDEVCVIMYKTTIFYGKLFLVCKIYRSFTFNMLHAPIGFCR